MSDPALLVLASLAEGDKHGYAMMEDIEQFAGVRLGPGTLYGAITRLEQRGWIRPVVGDHRRQPYRLTAAGRKHLQAELQALSRIVKTGATDGDLIDPRFERGAMPPFGWELASGSAGVAEPTGDGSLHVLFYGRDNLALARQLLLLKPGRYRLSMRVNGAEPSAESLSWAVSTTFCGQPF